MTLDIRLRERGRPVVVSTEAWQSLNLELPMRALAGARILKLTRIAVGVMLTPGNHVGEMRGPGVRLVVESKSPDMVAAMDLVANSPKSKTAKHYDPDFKENAGSEADPAGAFVRAVLGCINEGFPWTYGVVTEATSYPRGRLDTGATVRRFLSKGIHHRVVVTRPIRQQDVGLVKVVRAAYECLAILKPTATLLAQAEMLMVAIDQEPNPCSLEDAIEQADALLNALPEHFGEEALELLKRSRDLLVGAQLHGYVVVPIPNGIARFRDLEELWERCVERLVDGVSQPTSSPRPTTAFHGLREAPQRLFQDGGPKLDPDVTTSCGGRVTGMFDAKYKQLEMGDDPDAGDLYQLTAYVRRTQAALGMLVHFAEERPGAARVGTTPEGADILVTTVSPALLRSERERALLEVLGRRPTLLKTCQDRLRDGLGRKGSNSVPDLAGDVLLRP